jgi:hypothetical protein
MKYVLITDKGRQFVYYVRGCAEIFQRVYGGEIHELQDSIIIGK